MADVLPAFDSGYTIQAGAVKSGSIASGQIGGFHVAAAAIVSANLGSGIPYHIEAFIGSTDANGFWSAAWKTAFGAAPVVNVNWNGRSGQGRHILIMSASPTAAYGATLRSGGSGPGTSGVVHILAIG